MYQPDLSTKNIELLAEDIFKNPKKWDCRKITDAISELKVLLLPHPNLLTAHAFNYLVDYLNDARLIVSNISSKQIDKVKEI